MSPKLAHAVKEWRELYLPACPVCQSEDLAVSEAVNMPLAEQATPGIMNVMSFVPIGCLGCGHVLLVSEAQFKQPPKRRELPKSEN